MKTLPSIDYKFYRPAYEVVVFPCHDIYEQEPLPVVMGEREANEITLEWAYYKGYQSAHYPVPAIPVRVGFVPSGGGGMRGVPYIWVTYGYNRLTTFWKGYDPILEWYDTDGHRHIRRIVSFK